MLIKSDIFIYVYIYYDYKLLLIVSYIPESVKTGFVKKDRPHKYN